MSFRLSELSLPHCIFGHGITTTLVRRRSGAVTTTSRALPNPLPETSSNRFVPLVKQMPSLISKTFHRLRLPKTAIPLTSEEGQQIFQEAFNAGTTSGCLRILPVLEMQTDLTFCGIATLSSVLKVLSVLNAL